MEERYQTLLNSQLVGVALSDGNEKIYRINDKFLDIIGYSRADFDQEKITWSAITPLKYDKLDQEKLAELTSDAYVDMFEKEYIHKDGHSIPVVVGAELLSTRPSLNISFAFDLTKQKQLEKEKDDVISLIGHELKTPFSILQVQAELLYREVESGITQKKLLKKLKEFDQSIHQIDEIVSHILTHNKLRIKKERRKRTNEFDVSFTLRKVVQEIRLLTDRKVFIEKADKNCYMEGDETEIRELLMNLISNALRYSPDYTHVKTSITRTDDVIRISIQDWGRGIRHADQKKIFQKSYQVRHPNGEIEKSSRGLGLYLCKQIVKAHNGKIEVHSRLGQGSTFTCVFKSAH